MRSWIHQLVMITTAMEAIITNLMIIMEVTTVSQSITSLTLTVSHTVTVIITHHLMIMITIIINITNITTLVITIITCINMTIIMNTTIMITTSKSEK